MHKIQRINWEGPINAALVHDPIKNDLSVKVADEIIYTFRPTR